MSTTDAEQLEKKVMSLVMPNWTDDKPTTPGWYWYEDELYGPAPVYMDWTGFFNQPTARQLEVDMAVEADGSDSPLDMDAEELKGRWAGPFSKPMEGTQNLFTEMQDAEREIQRLRQALRDLRYGRFENADAVNELIDETLK